MVDIDINNCELSTNEYQSECQTNVHKIEQYVQASKVAEKPSVNTIMYCACGTMTKNNRLRNNTTSTIKKNELDLKNR